VAAVWVFRRQAYAFLRVMAEKRDCGRIVLREAPAGTRREAQVTPKERVALAVAHRATDMCPYGLKFGAPLRERLVDFAQDPEFDRDLEAHLVTVGPAYPETNERVDERHYTDAFGVIWEDSFPGEIGMVREPILREPSLRGYEFPPARAPGLFDGIEEEIAQYRDAYLCWGIGFSLYERAWTLRGIESFLLDMVDHPQFADELLDEICEFNLELIEQACRFDLDCIRFGDDWGAQQGLIMGPRLWRRFIGPRLARMVERVHRYGKTAFVHSDGDVQEVLPDLIEMGLDILNPVQPDVMDVYEIKHEYGREITFHGGVSVQHLLPESAPEGVRAEVRRLIREVGAGGGFIIAPTHSLGQDIPLENLLVLVDEFAHQAARH
jgi:uroporphyrinogen decarboxylase